MKKATADLKNDNVARRSRLMGPDHAPVCSSARAARSFSAPTAPWSASRPDNGRS